jgi:nucleoside phosphorylase
VRVAFLAPMKVELDPLVRLLSLGSDGDLRTGVHGGTEVVATMIGVGPERAAVSTTRLLSVAAIDHVVVVGIAGGVAESIAIGDLVVPETVISDSTGASYHPAAFCDLVRRGTILTTDGILSGPEVLSGHRSRGITAVDMES